MENGQFYIISESVIKGNSSTPLCKKYSEVRNSQSSRLQSVLNDHIKIGPETGIGVFKSVETSMIEVQVPTQQSGNPKSWMSATIYSCRDCPQNIDVASSQQSIRCGRSRVQETSEISLHRYEAASKT